jgi:hypothetical protein
MPSYADPARNAPGDPADKTGVQPDNELFGVRQIKYFNKCHAQLYCDDASIINNYRQECQSSENEYQEVDCQICEELAARFFLGNPPLCEILAPGVNPDPDNQNPPKTSQDVSTWCRDTPEDEVCDDEIDNDNDGKTDCDDLDCKGDSACVSVDISFVNRVSIDLSSLFVSDENPEEESHHKSTLGDYGLQGTVSGDTYTVDTIEVSEDERWKRTLTIAVDFDWSHKNITKIDYKNTYEDTETQYKEEYGLLTKSGIGIPLINSTSSTLVYEAKGKDADGKREVCKIVESFYKRRYRSENGELFDYIEYLDCDDSSVLTVTFYN